MAPSDKASLNSFIAAKSSDSSSSNSSRKVRRDACKSAPPVRMTPQFFVFGSPAPRCSRRITLPSPSSVIASDNEIEQAEVRVAWDEDSSCGLQTSSMQMKDLLINHSAASVAMKLQNCAPKAPTPGRHVSARVSRPSFISHAAARSRAVAPRSAPLPKYQANNKQSSVLRESSSSSCCSVSASSAGDIATAATDRPPGPSPPSSLSTVSPACSLPLDCSTSSQSTADEEEHLVQRYSFPVPPLELCEALETGDFTRATPHSTENSDISHETAAHQEPQNQTSNVSLIDIQEKVIELVEAQRVCSQLTWCAMQHLSATLERLCPNVEPTVSEQRAAIAPPLLLEAAGCARRLAHILVQLGEAPSMQTSTPVASVSAPAAVAVRPSASELQQQRARLRHVKSRDLTSPPAPATDQVAEALRTVVARRRLSMETISSRTSTSSGAPSCWDT